MRRIVYALFLTLVLLSLGLADETSFRRIKVPDVQGRQTNAVLTFSDEHKAIEVSTAKRRKVPATAASIPYGEIDKVSYEFTKRRRVNEGTVMTAPVGIGAVMMFTKSRSHWLEIDYREENLPKVFVLRMDKHDYLRILDAVNAHTGKDAEVLGNAEKR